MHATEIDSGYRNLKREFIRRIWGKGREYADRIEGRAEKSS